MSMKTEHYIIVVIVIVGFSLTWLIKDEMPKINYERVMKDCKEMGKQKSQCKAYWLGHADASGVLLEPPY